MPGVASVSLVLAAGAIAFTLTPYRCSSRCAMIVSVPAAPAGVPAVLFADGPPCRAPMQDATDLWAAAVSQ